MQLSQVDKATKPCTLYALYIPEDTMRKRTIVVYDKMQKDYKYTLTEPVGKNFHPNFKPELTPQQMLRLGVFGGKYMTDCQNEFPKTWFVKAKLHSEKHDASLNYFGVNASQSLAVWRQKHWIHQDDPRGWFQWYCRYYAGRRHNDDSRQIKRWQAIKRHIAQIRNNCIKGSLNCRKKQRQAVLHWAYDSRRI